MRLGRWVGGGPCPSSGPRSCSAGGRGAAGESGGGGVRGAPGEGPAGPRSGHCNPKGGGGASCTILHYYGIGVYLSIHSLLFLLILANISRSFPFHLCSLL